MAKEKVHTIEPRDIVKEYAELYRETEQARINKENAAHFVEQHPELKKNDIF